MLMEVFGVTVLDVKQYEQRRNAGILHCVQDDDFKRNDNDKSNSKSNDNDNDNSNGNGNGKSNDNDNSKYRDPSLRSRMTT